MRLLRSILFILSGRSAGVEKAAKSDADAVCIDLEDSVPLELKQASREGVAAAASVLKEAGKVVCIRINNTPQDVNLDINSLNRDCNYLFFPKVADIDQLAQICDATQAVAQQNQNHLRCIAMVEDAGSLLSLQQNLGFGPNRLFGLSLGTEYLANALNCKPDAALVRHCFY